MSNSEDSQQYLNDMLVKEEDEASGGKQKTIHNRVFCCLTLIFHPADDSDKQDGGIMLREQDRFLPICNIIKIMKVPVPQNGKIAKDARECIRECVSSSYPSLAVRPSNVASRRIARQSTGTTCWWRSAIWDSTITWNHCPFTCKSTERSVRLRYAQQLITK